MCQRKSGSKLLHSPLAGLLSLAVGVLLLSANAVAAAQQFVIGAYHLQSSVRSSLYDYDYTYTVSLMNTEPAADGVVGMVSSSSQNTTVLSGTVNFGTVPANSSVTSTGTFTIRQDRRYAFEPSSLVWSFASSGMLRLSTTLYDFGQDLVGNAVVKTVATVTNTGSSTIPLHPTVSGSSFSLVPGVAGACGATLAAGTNCSLTVQYLPQAASSTGVSATISLGATGVAPGTLQSVTLTGMSAVLTPGLVTKTANLVVAGYALTLPYAGTWTVQFGPTTSYGLMTKTVTATAGAGGTVLVAGMRANTTYHMRASVTLADGVTATDIDHTFTTGASPAGVPASFPVTLGASGTPQPGIELVNPFSGALQSTALATDLGGNVIWSYPFADRTAGTYLYPIKQIENGNFLIFISPQSYPVVPLTGQMNSLREIDLAGTTVRELPMTILNSELAAAGFDLTLAYYSHDYAVLPNGHVLMLANTVKQFTDLPGYPGVTNVVGDVVVDLDASWKPVWVWNEFDHFDVNRHPWQFPDWTHSNSVTYSPTDGNFVVSMRHQNWIVKVNYKNGAGDGGILWKLGNEGDFKLVGGVDPTDWFYAQHNAVFSTPLTAGVFSLQVMDNGDDRVFAPGVTCGTATGPACLYTTVQDLQIDETAKTATFQFHDILSPSLYSSFAGNVELLANGNTEFDLAGSSGGANIFEVKTTATPQTVWQMMLPGSTDYRAFRIPSLYPGVQW